MDCDLFYGGKNLELIEIHLELCEVEMETM